MEGRKAWKAGRRTWGWIMTLKGAVLGCRPGAGGPSGLAKCRKGSVSAMLDVNGED